MVFLIVYGALAVVSFVLFTILGEIGVKAMNSPFKNDVYRLSYMKMIGMAILFPFVWVIVLIHTIVNRKDKKQ